MANFEHKSFAYYQVDRPVIEGGGVFIRRLRELGAKLGSITTTAITETILTEDALEHKEGRKVLVKPLQDPLLDVFRQNELRLILYRRVVQADSLKSYLLSAIESSADHEIGFHDELQNFDSRTKATSSLICDRVSVLDDLAYGRTIALTPKLESKEALEVQRQAAVCRDWLDREAPELGRDSMSLTGTIPVASVPESISQHDTINFVEEVNNRILPIKVAVGGIESYRAFTLSNKLVN